MGTIKDMVKTYEREGVLEPQPDAEGWRKNTGKQPVDNHIRVEVRLHRGDILGPCRAQYFVWDLSDSPAHVEIAEWRLVETKPAESEDKVNHPSHYTAGGVECIDAIEAAVTGLQGLEAVCTANVIKYVWRWKLKNGAEDLKKARWYLDKLIKQVEGEPENG